MSRLIHVGIVLLTLLIPFSAVQGSDLQHPDMSPVHLNGVESDWRFMSSLNQTAELIVRGTVRKIDSQLRDKSIWSRAEVAVESVERGQPVSKVYVEYEGGDVGGLALIVSNQPRFNVEDHVLLYLVRGKGDAYSVVGGPAGKILLGSGGMVLQQSVTGYSYEGFHWPSSKIPVGYYVNTSGGPTGALSAVQAGFQSWNSAGAIFSFQYLGTTTRGCDFDGYNVVSWQHIDGVGGALAVATTWYQPPSTELVECDIRLDVDDSWATDGSPTKYDVQNIAAHESGHWLQLLDLYDSQSSEMTMYGYAGLGETKKRTLELGDIAGIRAIYGSSGSVTATVTTTTTTTLTRSSISYASTAITMTQRSTTVLTSILPVATLSYTTLVLSGSVSTTYTSRTTLMSASASYSTTTSASSGTSVFTSTELSKAGTVMTVELLTSVTTAGNTVFVNMIIQQTLVEQFLQKITSTVLYWLSEFARVTLFLPGTAKDTTVKVEPGLGSTVGAVFGGSDPVGFLLTGNIYDDSGMLGIYAHRNAPKILFPKTDTGKVSSTGQPTWSGYMHLVTVGGHAANPTTKYYEDNGLAPIRAVVNSNGTISILRGSALQLNVPLSSVSQSNDYFVMQVLSDGAHKVVILWGIQQWGTYAAGVCFDGKYPDMASLTYGWYVVRWQDLNGNGIPDYPTEFIIVASGT